MKKRGQLALFVVLGVVLLILVAIMIYYRSSITESVSKNILQRNVILPREVNDVKDYVQRCVEANSVVTLYYLGSQGGLLSPSADKAIQPYSIAYGYNAGKNTLPSLLDFRKEFSNSMNYFLPDCLSRGNFGKLNVQGTTASTTLELLDDKVKVSVDYPVTVTEGENVFRLDDSYNVEYPLRIKLLHDISDGIVKRTASDPKNLDVSYLLGLGVKVDVYPFDAKTIVYSLEDSRSVYRNITYQYRFAVRHTK